MTDSPDPTQPPVEMEPLLDEEERNKVPVWAWWLFGAVALLLILLVWLAIANSTDAENAPIPEPTATASASPSPSPEPSDSPTPMPSPTDVPSEEPSDSPTPMPSPTDVPSEEPSDSPTPMPSPTDEPAPPATTFTDGAYIAGSDIAVGTYRTTKTVTGGQCAWALAGTKASDGKIIPPLGAPAGGIPTVTAAKGDVIVTKGCGTWKSVDPASLFGNPSAKAVLADGVWLVGEDVRPGIYQTKEIAAGVDPEKLCRWTVSTDLKTNFSKIVVRGYVTEGVGKVDLKDGEQIESANCGDWIALSK